MNSLKIVTILVIAQIVIISASFGSLYLVEIQEENSVNYVNIAGKNRLYSALTFHEIDKFISGISSEVKLYRTFEEYSDNISLLKFGGYFLGNSVTPLSEKYILEIISVEQKLLELKLLTDKIKDSGGKATNIDRLHLERIGIELSSASNLLTEKLTINANDTVDKKENLGIILPIINASVYLMTIFVIFQTLKRENKRVQKLEKIYAIGQMASRLAHDLKNPLTVLKSSLEMIEIKDSTNSEFTKTMHDRMKRSIQDIAHIIEDVLEFVRTKELNISKSSLLKILNESISNINKPDTVSIELPSNDIELECDFVKLQAVFTNLFVNGMYALGNKGKITIKAHETDKQVEITVIDTGSGIPLDVLPHVFEPLFTSKPSGTGLGLGICKSIVEQHNGKISVSNDPTTFLIKLPKA